MRVGAWTGWSVWLAVMLLPVALFAQTPPEAAVSRPARVEAAPVLISSVPELPKTLDLSIIRAVPVQDEGRWPPLDTFVRRIVEQVTNGETLQAVDPVLALLAWTIEPEAWQHAPLIAIEDPETRRALKLPESQTLYSFVELSAHAPLIAMVDEAMSGGGGASGGLAAELIDLNARLILLRDAFSGELIRVIPNPDRVSGAWFPMDAIGMTHPESAEVVTQAWEAVCTAFRADNAAGFNEASQQWASALAVLPAASYPSRPMIQTELRYNRLQPFATAWKIMAVGALLATLAILVRRRWFDVLAAVVMLTGFVVLSYGLALRWELAGRIPAANMYESLLFLSWGMGAFAIIAVFVFPWRIVPMTSSAMGALALVLADVFLDGHVKPAPAVLMDTFWMSVHVPIIMASYSVLALGVCFAHAQLVISAFLPRRQEAIRAVDTLHYWYLHVGSVLLLAGVVTGSMWASSSWGRYWGWDPKEVWSLVACLGYLAILHVRIEQTKIPAWAYAFGILLFVALYVIIVPLLAPISLMKGIALAGTAAAAVLFVVARGRFATAIKSIVAFWLVIMTYLGVNYVLGAGLHSYGFGSGAVVRHMFIAGGIDLAIVAVCAAVYLWRRTACISAEPAV